MLRLVPASQVSAGVLVDLGCGERSGVREWARRFCARWRWSAPEMVEKFQAELEGVLAFFAFPAYWRHRLRTTNLGEGWFKHLRRYLSRFPGCRNAKHSEQFLSSHLNFKRLRGETTRAMDRTGNLALWSLLGLLAVLYPASLFGPPPPSVQVLAWSAMAIWITVPWAAWADRHRRSDSERTETRSP